MKKGHQVLGLGRRKDPGDFPFAYCSLDLGAPECVEELHQIIRANRVEVILHLASLDQKASEKLDEGVFQINVLGTQRLLNAMKGHPNVRMIFFSTVHVHGPIEGKMRAEQEKAPLKAYGLTHGLSEDLVLFSRRTEKRKFMVLRLSNGFGWSPVMNEQARSLVVNDLVHQAVKEKRLSLKSDGSPVLDFFWIGDLAPLLEGLVEGKDWPEIGLLASGEAISLYELAQKVSRMAGDFHGLPILKEGLPLEEPTGGKKIELMSNLPDWLPGWKPSSLETGITELYEAFGKKGSVSS